MLVEIRNHRSVSCTRSRMRKVTVLPSVSSMFLVPFFWVTFNPFLWRLHCNVRLNKRQIQKERLVFVRVKKLERLIQDQVRRIFFSTIRFSQHFPFGLFVVARNRKAVDFDFLFIAIQKWREEAMRVTLAVVPEVTIETLLHRRPRCVGRTKPPFPKRAVGVTGFLEDFRNRYDLIGDRPLTWKDPTVARVSIASNFSMCQVLPGH